MKFFTLLAAFAACAFSARAQEQTGQEPDDDRVQYTLILPEEKAPELVKAEETNPFESSANADIAADGDTEENKVRDILLRLPITGGVVGDKGMRIMLGGMRLEAGGDVPPVLPDQQVQLKVKAITANTVELVWVEKKPGLIPKSLVIPIDAAPKVHYQLPAYEGGGGMGSLRRDDVSAFARPAMPVLPSQAPAPPSSPEASKQTVLKAQPASDVDLMTALASAPLQPEGAARSPASEIAAAPAPAAAPDTVIPKALPVPEFNLIAELSAAPLVSGKPSNPAVTNANEPAPEVRVAQASTEVPVAKASPDVSEAQAPTEVRVAKAVPASETPAAAVEKPRKQNSELKPIAEASAPAASGNAPTASVWRMLFGNHAPADK